ncbi:hypothetical protein BOX15_Mlig032600g1 [Macrostomum lignano]|uniref:Uncharacterized protein n=2 Tax=Macrostomum lignano TaxID=282301 RepID=A0A267ENA0_9PLAT|nr:hypothetical protein BOX15_Mlig032600g2 [Macrostomum lignano]PAA63003.1 hypothetical protein BOX15_Mlig032600g1 [Macrostomum lignano]
MAETSEWREDMRDTFNMFDKNGNGEIEVNELRTVIQCLGQNPTEKDVQLMIQEYDLNKDGTINFEEFCQMMKNRIKTVESKQNEMKVAFQMFDKNGDGKISSNELMEVMTKLGEKLTMDEVKEMITEVDVNNDGFIDYGEFVQMYATN